MSEVESYRQGLFESRVTMLELLRNPTPAMLKAMRTGSMMKRYPSDELCRVRLAALAAAMESRDA